MDINMEPIMMNTMDSRRRTMVKALLWRLIGIVWTWVGAYVILIFIPDRYESAAMIATLIVAYHHSTRMIMYYFYERVWSKVQWGKTESIELMDAKNKAVWSASIIATVAVIFYLLMVVTPMMKS